MRAEEAADGVGFGDDVDLASQGFHHQPGRQVAAGVGHAQERVALGGSDHAQSHAQVARRLDQNRARPQQAVAFGGLDHFGGGLQPV